MASGVAGGSTSGGAAAYGARHSGAGAAAEVEEGEGAGRLAMESRKSEEEVSTEKGRQQTIDKNPFNSRSG